MTIGKVFQTAANDRITPFDASAYLALADDQFLPFFQPIITLRTGQLAGFEVLARWRHPTEGILAPDRFIHTAERDGWIDLLGQQILTKAFAAASAIPDHLMLAINISPLQLGDRHLPNQLQALALNAKFSLNRLIVEITESALIENPESALTIVSQLKILGCKLALDDFGTGYSSLLHLKSLPFDKIKVDRSFVGSMTGNRESRKIVSAVVGLGNSLGLATVAEGIETQEQAEMLLWLGCEFGQGYFYGPPLPEANLPAVLQMQRQKLVPQAPSPWRSFSNSNLDASPSQQFAQLQAVYDGVPVGLAFINQSLHYVNLNKQLADMNQATVEDHLGSKVSDIIPDLFPVVEAYLRRALNGEAIANVEIVFPANKRTRLVSYQPARDEAGEIVGVSVAALDITDRKKIDNALLLSEAHYRSMVELNPQVLWVMDSSGRNLDVSPRWNPKTGQMHSPSIECDWLKTIHPDDVQYTVRAIAQSRADGVPIDVQYRAEVGPDTWEWKRSMGAPRYGATGKILCWCGSVQDSNDTDVLQHQIASAPLMPKTPAVRRHSVKDDAAKRQAALLELAILDTPAEPVFDDLVALASELYSVPISLISLLDTERQWFKASVGLEGWETPLNRSLCAHAVRLKKLMVVEDATKDKRFKNNPAVTGEPHVRFYAGIPLYAAGGIAIGTLCIIDTVPRSLSPLEVKTLSILGQQVQAQLDLRYERKRLQKVLAENRRLLDALETPTSGVAINAQLLTN